MGPYIWPDLMQALDYVVKLDQQRPISSNELLEKRRTGSNGRKLLRQDSERFWSLSFSLIIIEFVLER
jgi:hypothetical protein